MKKIYKNYKALILGQAIGDSLLLPYEFLNRKKNIKRFDKHQFKQSFIGKYGMTSDDTDHMFLTGQSLLVSDNKEQFAIDLAKSLKWWLWSLPPGIGLSTLRSTIKLTLGYSYKNSGVFSAGNGPAMRTPIIALHFADDDVSRHEYIEASTRITNTDPKAVSACIALGNFIAYIAKNKTVPRRELLNDLLSTSTDDADWINSVKYLVNNLDTNLDYFVKHLGCTKGVSGYILHTVPFAIYVVLNSADIESAFYKIISAGGDTDTIGAIVGSIMGLLHGEEKFNNDMLKLCEYPRGVKQLVQLSHALNNNEKNKVEYALWATLPRNIFSLLFIIIHALLRPFI